MESRSSSVGGRSATCETRNTSASAAIPLRTVSGWSDLAQPQRVVEAAQAVPSQVDRDVCVAYRPQLAVDRFRNLRLESTPHLVGPELYPGNRIVMAYAADAKAQIAQHRLGVLDHAQLLARHLTEVWNTRREARRGRLVPR